MIPNTQNPNYSNHKNHKNFLNFIFSNFFTMDTNALKKFALDTRKQIEAAIQYRAKEIQQKDDYLTLEKPKETQSLRQLINAAPLQKIVEKYAYLWFNRLIAITYLELHNLSPLQTLVIGPDPSDPSALKPKILKELLNGFTPDFLIPYDAPPSQLPKGLYPLEYLQKLLAQEASPNIRNQEDLAYRTLLIYACNALHDYFPFLFSKICGLGELLLPYPGTVDLLQPFRNLKPQDLPSVEALGWIYQFYNAEKKDAIFAAKERVKKEDIPAATQLFTPRWIVEYMVQNTLGKVWLKFRPQSPLKEKMPYYLPCPQEEVIAIQSPEEIQFLDPACGSGHILVYAFELLFEMYKEEGYSLRTIPKLILENNLFGYDIDERAAQLAAFALLLKAKAYNPRLFDSLPVFPPHILYFEDYELAEGYKQKPPVPLSSGLKKDLEAQGEMRAYGSLYIPLAAEEELEKALSAIEALLAKAPEAIAFEQNELQKLKRGLTQLSALKKKFTAVVTNPPYMGSAKMNIPLSEYVRKHYPEAKADLMACFMEAGMTFLKPGGLLGMVNQQSWMFLTSYQDFRYSFLQSCQIATLLHLGPRAFPEIGGEIVQNVAFTALKAKPSFAGSYIRLVDYSSLEEKRAAVFRALQEKENFFTQSQLAFTRIPGSIVAYWVSEKVLQLWQKYKKLGEIGKAVAGLGTSDNDRFLRLWQEVSRQAIDFGKLDKTKKWFLCNKGGAFRKWHGNREYVVNWQNEGDEIRNFKDAKGKLRSRPQNIGYYFRACISWSDISSQRVSFRFFEPGFIFVSTAPSFFLEEPSLEKKVLGLINTPFYDYLADIINPTIIFNPGDFNNLPFCDSQSLGGIEELVEENIAIAKEDWNARETSWDFAQNELLKRKDSSSLIQKAVESYETYWRERFYKMHQNEEEIYRRFLEAHNLQDEFRPEIPLKDITLLPYEGYIENGELKFKRKELIEQLISYAVGCVFGRYNPQSPGLVLADLGQDFEDFARKVPGAAFTPLRQNFCLIADPELDFWEDDLLSQVSRFLETVWGRETYAANISFIEQVLGKSLKKYLWQDFYAFHIRRYQRRPIYWLISSKNGNFQVLFYLHRYNSDLASEIYQDLSLRWLSRLSGAIEAQEREGGGSWAYKRLEKLKAVRREGEDFARELLYPLAQKRIELDLDQGVWVNYNILRPILKEVGGLSDSSSFEKVKQFDWIDVSRLNGYGLQDGGKPGQGKTPKRNR
jgi:hypothetical protein